MSTSLAQPTFIPVRDGLSVYERAWSDAAQAQLPPDVRQMLVKLARAFEGKRQELLTRRRNRQKEFDDGALPGYLNPHSVAVTGDWRVREIPSDLLTRRVEITGPVNNRKMVINMLSRNAQGDRADCAMLDFEDAMMPCWANVIDGLSNVAGAARGDLELKTDDKHYALDPDDMAVVMVRVRGLHLNESNVRVDGTPISAAVFDLVASAYASARALLARGRTPKFYVPKVEHFLEARWWNALFSTIEHELELPLGTMRATFLIETLTGAFQMEEILYELRDHAVGLNVGRWDKIFSDIKTLRWHPDRIMADRGSIDMTRPWMRDYAARLVHICHRRGAFALGGMAAFTPGKTQARREEQMAKVVADKQMEASMGHDGCWVSHPFFIGEAQRQFPVPNQLDTHVDDGERYPDLLPRGGGPRTEAGLRVNIRVGIAYMYGWSQGLGCVAWDDLMEDLATLEISRAQVWQWLHHKVRLDDGSAVTRVRVSEIFGQEFTRIQDELTLTGDALEAWRQARDVALELFTQERFREFLTFESTRAGNLTTKREANHDA